MGRVRHIRNDDADRGVENSDYAFSGRLFAERNRPIVVWRPAIDFVRNRVADVADRVLRAAAVCGPVKYTRSEHGRQWRHCAHRQSTRGPVQSDVSSVTGPVPRVRWYPATDVGQAAVRHHPTDTAQSRRCSTIASS